MSATQCGKPPANQLIAPAAEQPVHCTARILTAYTAAWQLFASALTPSFITATVDQRRTTIVLCAECQTDRCLFIISASHITRRNYDGSHRRPCRCISFASHHITFTLQTQLIPSISKGSCVTDNLCTLSITMTTKGTVIAIIFAKFK